VFGGVVGGLEMRDGSKGGGEGGDLRDAARERARRVLSRMRTVCGLV
jgi:hypothetical protein